MRGSQRTYLFQEILPPAQHEGCGQISGLAIHFAIVVIGLDPAKYHSTCMPATPPSGERTAIKLKRSTKSADLACVSVLLDDLFKLEPSCSVVGFCMMARQRCGLYRTSHVCNTWLSFVISRWRQRCGPYRTSHLCNT